MDLPTTVPVAVLRYSRWALPSALAVVLLWASWPALREVVARWLSDPRYSHGFLVPAFSGYLLWSRRSMLAVAARPAFLTGLAFIALGEACRLAGTRYYLLWVEAVSLLPSLAGLALLTGGWNALRWSAVPILFLVFMIPLPYRVEVFLGSPLQDLATSASTYVLQTVGLPAVPEGNIIYIDEAQIGVVEACNGLGMILTFFAFATAVAIVVRSSPVERILVVLSAVPIALGANILRISATGILHRLAGSATADTFYHDLAGWLMMPVAVAAFGAELWIFSRLFVESPAAPRPVGV